MVNFLLIIILYLDSDKSHMVLTEARVSHGVLYI